MLLLRLDKKMAKGMRHPEVPLLVDLLFPGIRKGDEPELELPQIEVGVQILFQGSGSEVVEFTVQNLDRNLFQTLILALRVGGKVR
jgi:hypothetical protein